MVNKKISYDRNKNNSIIFLNDLLFLLKQKSAYTPSDLINIYWVPTKCPALCGPPSHTLSHFSLTAMLWVD